MGNVMQWIWERRGRVLLWAGLAVAGTIGLYMLAGWLLESENASIAAKLVCVALAVAGAVVAVHLVHCFTRNLPAPEATLSRELRSIFVYAYVFQSLAIVASLAPFLVSTESLSSRGSWAGVVHGCQRADDGYGSDLTRCEDAPGDQQWLLQIGSRSLPPQVAPDGEPMGRAESSRGLVVPLYVVVLAIIGGAVGMTRRLPEIQRRAAHSVQGKQDGDAISPIEAREMVVFQIMQILAAPLVAIVAFAAFEPDTVTAAVLVGFASGFASEAILMKLRQASEAVVGKAKAGRE